MRIFSCLVFQVLGKITQSQLSHCWHIDINLSGLKSYRLMQTSHQENFQRTPSSQWELSRHTAMTQFTWWLDWAIRTMSFIVSLHNHNHKIQQRKFWYGKKKWKLWRCLLTSMILKKSSHCSPLLTDTASPTSFISHFYIFSPSAHRQLVKSPEVGRGLILCAGAVGSAFDEETLD